MTQAILQCLPLLADILGRAYGITVEIGGSDAYTTGRIIRLPSLPATSDATFLGLVRGYIDHEAAHVRHTDFSALALADMTPLEKTIWNIFEDWRVEKAMAVIYPGCRRNFHWLVRHLFLDQQRPSVQRHTVVLDWLLLTVRSWSVTDLDPRCQEEADRIDHLWPGLRPKLETILTTMRGHCPDSLACVDYAKQVVQCLAKAARNPKPKRKAGPPDPDGPETTGSSVEKSEGSSQDGPSGISEVNQDLLNLINAKEDELPPDLGQVLRQSLSNGAATIGRCAVATIGDKAISPLSAPDLAEIQHITAGLRSRFHGLFQATRLVRQAPSRKGRLDPHRLHGVAIRNPKVFLTHRRKPAINTAVHILLDASGSMDKRIKLAGQCCHAVAQALNQTGISVGVTAFPGRQQASVVPILPHGDRVHGNFVVDAGGMTPLAESLWWVLQRLVALPEERRIVLIVTDGTPDNFTSVIDTIARARAFGIEIHGLGIDAPVIRQLLPHSSRSIASLSELPAALFSMLETVLTTQGRAS